MTSSPEIDARSEFSLALQSGNLYRAMAVVRDMLGRAPRVRDFIFIANELRRSAIQEQLPPFRAALLSSFSLEFIHDVLVVYGFLNSLAVEIYQAGFAQYRQEIFDPASGLYGFSPKAAVLAIEGEDAVPRLYRDYLDLAGADLDGSIAAISSEYTNLVSTFRKHSDAPLLVHNFAPPTYPELGILDTRAGTGQTQAIHQLNGRLAAVASGHTGVYMVDYAALVSRFGACNWYDRRMRHYAKAPVSIAMLPQLAAEYAKYFRALSGGSKKCLILDLDNTLWGGVLGEDGPQGIDLGPTYPGSAYVEFQRQILALHKRGVVLAIASKNNAADVEDLFASHPHMVLKKEHFADSQVNWLPKSENIAEIARKLNIGLDHVVFLDDSPAECEQVAAALPMVTVRALAKQPEDFTHLLMEEGLFDTLSFSEEDRHRSSLYQQRAQAEQMRKAATSLEDFYRGLAMEVDFAAVDQASLPRAAQLTQKTNQFNTTTRRYTESEMAELMRDRNWILRVVTLRDRFGNNGIVGLMMARIIDGEAVIESFLLSCRVIGRTVETAMLAYLNALAMVNNIQQLRGRIIPTQKNHPVRELYDKHGFSKVATYDSGVTEWILPVAEHVVRFPEWISMKTEAVAAAR